MKLTKDTFWQELEAHQAALATAGAPEVQREELAGARAWLNHQTELAREEEAGAHDEYGRLYRDWHGEPPRTSPAPSSTVWAPANLGRVLQLFVALLSGYWLAAQMYVRLPRVNPILIGALVAVVIYVISHIPLAREDDRKPRAVRDWLRRLSNRFGAAWLAALVIVVLASLASPQRGWSRGAVGAAMLALFVLSAMHAAVLGVLSRQLRWANPAARRWKLARSRAEALTAFQEECRAAEERLAKADPPRARPHAA